MALSTRSKRRRHQRQLMADINVTPMVDVMLVLLVIFMVTAPMLTTGVDVNLPEGEATALPQETEPPLALTITAEGEMYLQDEPIARDELEPKLEAIMANRQSDKIYLRADGDNSYSTIFDVMGMLTTAGYTNIGLVGDIGAGNAGAQNEN